MNIRNLLIAVLITLLLGSSFPAYSGGPSGDRKISYIEVTSTGTIIIQSATNFNNPDVCRNPHRIVILASNVDRNLYYAAALTAYSTDNYVWAWLKGCWEAPWGEQYPIVINVASRSAQ
jgi:hypothetical protein